jgi:hypothetical protein
MKTATSLPNLRSLRGSSIVDCLFLLAAVLLGGAMGSAQTAPVVSHPATRVAGGHRQVGTAPAHHGEEEKSETKADDASHQGIKVHGHWKIDIQNADGSLASTHEFENSLNDYGSLFVYLLASKATSGEADIQLYSAYDAYGNPVPICGTQASCRITESSTGYWATIGGYCTSNPQTCAYNLNVTPQVKVDPTTGPYAANIVLSGNIVASHNATITDVFTLFAACSNYPSTGLATMTPAQCHSGTVPAGTSVNTLPGIAEDAGLTRASFLSISVLSGQTIQVTVTLSFS